MFDFEYLEAHDGYVVEISKEKFLSVSKKPDYIHIVGIFRPTRLGVALFNVLLEHIYYPPLQPENKFLLLHYVKWQDMIWTVSSIPAKDKDSAQAVCRQTGLRIVEGVPTVIGSQGVDIFPLNKTNVFGLEYISGHPCYNSHAESFYLQAEYELMQQAAKKVNLQDINLLKSIKSRMS